MSVLRRTFFCLEHWPGAMPLQKNGTCLPVGRENRKFSARKKEPESSFLYNLY